MYELFECQNHAIGNLPFYYIAEPLVEAPTIDEVEEAILKLKYSEAPGNETIPAEFFENEDC